MIHARKLIPLATRSNKLKMDSLRVDIIITTWLCFSYYDSHTRAEISTAATPDQTTPKLNADWRTW
jgi:hypothetical protein